MWKHTDEDLEAIALEKADRIRDESLPDWFYHGGEKSGHYRFIHVRS